jgi:LysM repeat protein
MLGRIAKKNGTTVAKIKALNDLKTSSIKVGQKLKIPGATSTAAVMPAPTPAPAPPVLTPPSYATTSQPAVGSH